MDKISLLILIIFLIVSLIIRLLFINAPLTSKEATEIINSASVALTGHDIHNRFLPLIFKGENNFPSMMAIYLRVPLIMLIGLNNYSLRLPGIILGGLSIVLFLGWLYFLKLNDSFWQRNNKTIILVASFFIFFSPGLIQLHVFDLTNTVAIFFLISGIFLWESKRNIKAIAVIFLILAIFSSWYSLPAAVLLLLIKGFLSFTKKGLLLGILPVFIFFLILTFNNTLANYFTRQSFLSDLQPANYLWQIERRLSYDQVEKSPLETKSINFNRFIHNRWLYLLNKFFSSLVLPFNLERLSFPLQSQSGTILAKEALGQKNLPLLFFFEIPLIILGLLKYWRLKHLCYLSLAFFLPVLFFGKNYQAFFYPLMFFIIFESLALVWITQMLRGLIKYFILATFFMLVVLSQLSLFDLIIFHQEKITTENDFRLWQISNFLEGKEDDYERIIITDLFGPPNNYLLYYTKNSLGSYQKTRQVAYLNTDGEEVVDTLGKYHFGSFKFMESERKPKQLWIGIAGEFVGKFNSYQGVDKITDGRILEKIKGVQQKDQFLGDELWFVETYFPKKEELVNEN